ncbi:hypothetical protein BCR35DRAFT_305526 [Leucosporidium creatinivorum]|uniref:Uncharacterized protein n=1 Tax=Leucosporidium creatinivorum TaxID=106004 RepID=A0A1Y2F1L5_9BASI|nr:hypothetical protein BCR35DRAFT_305526 [Leucosporidium creatinivorum]
MGHGVFALIVGRSSLSGFSSGIPFAGLPSFARPSSRAAGAEQARRGSDSARHSRFALVLSCGAGLDEFLKRVLRYLSSSIGGSSKRALLSSVSSSPSLGGCSPSRSPRAFDVRGASRARGFGGAVSSPSLLAVRLDLSVAASEQLGRVSCLSFDLSAFKEGWESSIVGRYL